jgi:phenol 2-monooxygenase
MQLGDSLKSDGRWRLVVFAGDVTQPAAVERLRRLGDELQAVGSFWNRLLADATLEPILVHASARRSVELFALHSVFYSREKEGYDYYRAFADDESYHHDHGRAYAKYGVEPEKGQSVLIRPDQYIGWVGMVDDLESLESYLSAVPL